MRGKKMWIWYPGDMELFFALKQNFSRVERGVGWPAFWKSEAFRQRIVLRRTYRLAAETSFTVYANADSVGFVLVGEKKYPFGKPIICGPGEVKISIHLGSIPTFPAAFIEGAVIRSDENWMAEDYAGDPVPVGHSPYFVDRCQDPSEWPYEEKMICPAKVEEVNQGLLFTFETELTALPELEYPHGYRACRLYIGETKAEALDTDNCYSFCDPGEDGLCPKNAVHYVFIPSCKKGDVLLRARQQFVDIPVRAEFHCDNEKLNRIWKVAEHTFRLCSGIFFLDGVKRDRWIWGGDAYQSMQVNQYLFGDPEINRRTMRALFGNVPAVTHINTITDYSMLCIIGVREHAEVYGDLDFLKEMYPKMRSLMELCLTQTEENGFFTGGPKDWVYIDWAEFDREGPLCAEQMLLARCCQAMAECCIMLQECDSALPAQGEPTKNLQLRQDLDRYTRKYQVLKEKIDQFYWDEEKGAYIDSFVSGKRNVTRHANIFAIRFDLADEAKKERIVKNVLQNNNVPAITTPYFRFFEQDALCMMGCLDQVLDTILSYWGGMLALGADTFWEEYDPQKPLEQQYEMYGDPFGKSMCHAWSASPIYLIGKYFLGLRISHETEEGYEIRPYHKAFQSVEAVLPAGNITVEIRW
ncbi:MAG: alpha-L-rhamnosidase [Blautia sp.]|nr:alpha-L-rhamnosidase [Blautia sp.]